MNGLGFRKRAVVLIETRFMNYKCLRMRSHDDDVGEKEDGRRVVHIGSQSQTTHRLDSKKVTLPSLEWSKSP